MSETVTISLPQAIRRELDRVAEEEGVSRSDVLRQLLEDFLFVRSAGDGRCGRTSARQYS